MKLVYFFRLALIAVVLLGSTTVFAQTTRNVQNDYTVSSSPYSYTAVSASNSVSLVNLQSQGVTLGDLDDGYVLINLPFAFSFNGDYTSSDVRVYTNGSIQVKRSPGVYSDFDGAGSWQSFYGYPGSGSNGQLSAYKNDGLSNMIFGWGCDFNLNSSASTSTGWYYAIQGTAPNRRAVFEWRSARLWSDANNAIDFTFQIILNETSNAIDVVFGTMSGTFPSLTDYNFYTGLNEGTSADASTGLTAKSLNGQSGNYIGSQFNGSGWSHSSNLTDPFSASSSTFPTNQSVRYCYVPNIAANPASVTLFDAANDPNDRIDVGGTLTKQYVVSNPSTSTAPAKITTQISGAGAGAYSVSPSIVASLAPGASQTFTVTFAPSGFGNYNAIMQVFVSSIDGATCPVNKTPATITMNARVLGLTSQISPLAVNFGQVGINAIASRNIAMFKNDATIPLTYYFTGLNPSTAEFYVTGASGIPKTLSGTVNPGAYVYLPVQFNPTIIGAQAATLNSYYTNQSGTAQSSTQTISLSAEGVPSRIKLTKEGSSGHLASGSVFAQSKSGDIGEPSLAFNFSIANTGLTAPINIYSFRFYNLDVDNPVNNRFRVQWSGGSFGVGTPVRSNDFVVQQLVNGQYVTVGSSDVVTVTAGNSVPMRVLFSPTRRGVKFVRMFFNSDATADDNFNSLSALNESDILTPTLQSYDFYGINAHNSQIATLTGLHFNPVTVGDSASGYIEVRNIGDARLLIEQNTLKLLAGDADFTLDSVFVGMSIDNGRYVIPVGSTGRIYVKFKPRAGGTRLTTLYFVSNDSSDIKGEVGKRYVSIVGEGLATTVITVSSVSGLPAFNQDTAIVSVPSSYKVRNIDIANTGKNEVVIKEVSLTGVDKGEYTIVSGISGKLPVGQTAEVTVEFAPKSGGSKNAQLVIKSNADNGDEIIQLTGFAGVRTIGTTTPKVFNQDTVAVNEGVKRTVVVTNTGTVDLDVSSAEISGVNKDDYSYVANGSTTIGPNQTVAVEVELKSSSRGVKSAMLTFGNNSTNNPLLAIELAGFVGIRSYTVDPQQFSISTSKGSNGQYIQKEGCVDVKNTGDIAMEITNVQITGSGADQFVIGNEPSGPIAPGETVKVCFTYKPTSDAEAQATMTITTNGEPPTVEVFINGKATGVGEGVSGVAVGIYPNPLVSGSRGVIVYESGRSERVSIELYTILGERVRSILSNEEVGAGEHRVEVVTEGLSSGMYYYRLTTSHSVYSLPFQIVK